MGRRVLQRQPELNLSVGEVAERSGMAADYVEYLEQAPIAEPTSSALLRLALALETSVSELLGGEQGRLRGLAGAARTRT